MKIETNYANKIILLFLLFCTIFSGKSSEMYNHTKIKRYQVLNLYILTDTLRRGLLFFTV